MAHLSCRQPLPVATGKTLETSCQPVGFSQSCLLSPGPSAPTCWPLCHWALGLKDPEHSEFGYAAPRLGAPTMWDSVCQWLNGCVFLWVTFQGHHVNLANP